jgi:single-strand DNA-binding protein
MINDLNRTTLIGYLAADAEVKSAKGNDFVIFTVATNNRWKDDAGNRQTKTQWHNIVVWKGRGPVTYAAELKKGDRVYLEGELQYGSYDKTVGEETVRIPTAQISVTNIERLTQRAADESSDAA